MVAVITSLAKVIGPVLAKGVLDKLVLSKGSTTKLQGAMEATEKGVSIIAALRGEFGDDFLKALSGTVGTGKAHGWSFEAGSADYVKLNPEGGGQEKLTMLRDELNVNLDRLIVMGEIPEEAIRNYFRGTLSIWKMRYVENMGIDDDTKKLFAAMDELLDGAQRTFKDVLETISKTSIGGVGALMVISGVLLATSTGVGVVTVISTFLFGIPWLSVGALVIPGAILLALSRYKFGNKHAMSTCVRMAYKLLESRNVPLVQT